MVAMICRESSSVMDGFVIILKKYRKKRIKQADCHWNIQVALFGIAKA
jgi:hypothetical protein